MSASILANLLCDNPVVVTGAGSFSAAEDISHYAIQAASSCSWRREWRPK